MIITEVSDIIPKPFNSGVNLQRAEGKCLFKCHEEFNLWSQTVSRISWTRRWSKAQSQVASFQRWIVHAGIKIIFKRWKDQRSSLLLIHYFCPLANQLLFIIHVDLNSKEDNVYEKMCMHVPCLENSHIWFKAISESHGPDRASRCSDQLLSFMVLCWNIISLYRKDK